MRKITTQLKFNNTKYFRYFIKYAFLLNSNE